MKSTFNNILKINHGSLVIAFLILCFPLSAKDIVLIDTSIKAPINEREAILILPGFGTLIHSPESQKTNFKNKGYDVYIPDYISRKTMDKCVKNLDVFIKKHQLTSYKKLHVFCYIIGSWTFNLWMKENMATNISSIVYDRSPLQEKAPIILVKENPLLSRVLFGKLIREMSKTPYPSISKGNYAIGIIIESKATKIIWKKRKALQSLPPISWDKANLNQEYDDYFYIFMNHDEMYTALEGVAPEIFYFIKNRKFTAVVSREPLNQDPFITFRSK